MKINLKLVAKGELKVKRKMESGLEINNVRVYDSEESIKASGYPRATNLDELKVDNEQGFKLAEILTGSGHDCFLKEIIVNFDIKATVKWWIEFGRYHFSYIISSQSKMHKIDQMNFEEVYNEYVTEAMLKEMQRLKSEYYDNPSKENYFKLLYFELLHDDPSGMLITAKVTTNYLQLKTMYQQRKNHKLPEWSDFCSWIESLPNSELIIGKP